MSAVRTRFAPSPNGLLHLGHAFSALFAADVAVRSGGEFVLRIEDIDRQRSRRHFEEAIYEDLAWLGLCWPHPVRRQSEHMEAYGAALEKLKDLGVVYPCFASRAAIARALPDGGGARDPDGAPLYPGLWRNRRHEAEARLAAGEPCNWRLHMARACARVVPAGERLAFEELGTGPDGEHGIVRADPRIWGDVVIARKDTPTSYHLSVVVDDAVQDISHVTRGQDLFHATGLQRLLQELLGLPAPRYIHHGLVRGADGRKLSKSAGDQSLAALRAAGLSPARLRRLAEKSAGFAGRLALP